MAAATWSRTRRSLLPQLSRGNRAVTAGPSSIGTSPNTARRSASSAASPTDLLDPYTASSSSIASSSTNLTAPKRTYGQPLPHSHPHLFPRRGILGSEDAVLRPGDPLPQHGLYDDGLGIVATEQLTPGIPKSEYEQRRKNLMERLPDNSLVLAMSGRVKSMSANIFYKFRQESNFWYLTGFQEPHSAVILEKHPSSSRGYKMTMFVQKRDPHNETWNGPITGLDGAVDIFAADEAFELDPAILLNHLKQVLPRYTHIYVEPPFQASTPRRGSAGAACKTPNILNYLAPPSTTSLDVFSKKSDFDQVIKLLGDTRKCHSLSGQVERLRFKKSLNEIRIMKRAGKASGEAMAETMGFVRPGVSEAQLQAVFEYNCALRGSQRPAYVPVVASGCNALTIHYVNNDRLVEADQLVCIDAGGELDGYASDITRAFPCNSNGLFSSPQKDLYSAILAVLKSCTSLATESQCYTLADLHRHSVHLLRQELIQIGFHLSSRSLETILYPHYIGHWLGIDLHDCPSVPRTNKLEEGVALTIEPGVYVPFDDAFPKAFQGMGVRIEDDIALVGKQGNLLLSSDAPKEVQDVEAACQNRLHHKHSSKDIVGYQPDLRSWS